MNPSDEGLEKRAVVLTEQEKKAHDKAAAQAVKKPCCERDTDNDGNCDRHPGKK